MRKLLILAILCMLVAFSYVSISRGANFSIFSIKSYAEIQTKSDELEANARELETKTTTEYNEKTSALKIASDRYRSSKEEFQALEEAQKEAVKTTVELVDIDFLWTIIGNYATENKVALQLDVKESVLKQTESTSYVLGDLYFKLEGNYSDVSEFVYDIENDDRLGFEISCFEMLKHEIKIYGEQNMTAEEIEFERERQEKWVDATFVVKGIPLNSVSISEITTPETENAVNDINAVVSPQ